MVMGCHGVGSFTLTGSLTGAFCFRCCGACLSTHPAEQYRRRMNCPTLSFLRGVMGLPHVSHVGLCSAMYSRMRVPVPCDRLTLPHFTLQVWRRMKREYDSA